MIVDEEAKYLKPAMKVRHGFFLIFKEALRMICQHSGGKNTRIQMTLEKNNLIIKIEDKVAVNAEDIKVSKNLEAIYLHAGQINANVNIQLEKDATAVALTVPLSGA